MHSAPKGDRNGFPKSAPMSMVHLSSNLINVRGTKLIHLILTILGVYNIKSSDDDDSLSTLDDSLRSAALTRLRGGNTDKFSLIRWTLQQIGQLYKRFFKKRDIIIKQGLTRVVKESLPDLTTPKPSEPQKITKIKSNSLIRLRNVSFEILYAVFTSY